MDFSIIIPAKNEEINLKACLESLTALDYPSEKYEILLIDNGSTDSTVEVAHSYNVKVYIKPDLTISGLRNFGATESTGDVLAFLDADCTVFPDWLDAASKWINTPEISCYGGPPEIPQSSTWVQKSWYLVREKDADISDVEWLESMNMFVRRELFLEVAGFDESLTTCEDYDLSLRLKGHGRIVADKSIRAVHHGEAASLSHFYKKESWRGTSNIAGLLRHGVHLRELPSILIPCVYSLCLLLSGVLLVTALVSPSALITKALLWTLCWQAAIYFLAYLKGKRKGTLYEITGLFVLLNIYFFARFRSMLRMT